MSAQSIRLADAVTLGPNQVMQRDQVPDLGAHRVLEIAIRVLRPGGATDTLTWIELQHAAVNEPDAFGTLGGTQVRVDSTAPVNVVFISVPAFTRYIRWKTGAGSFAGNPIVTIDIVAKS